MIPDSQCAFQLRAFHGIPWHRGLTGSPAACPGWPFGSVVDLLCTIKAGQNRSHEGLLLYIVERCCAMVRIVT